jgi:hypothetical protein
MWQRRRSCEQSDSVAARRGGGRRGKRRTGERHSDRLCQGRIDQRRRVYNILLLRMVRARAALKCLRRPRAVRFRSFAARHLRHRAGARIGHTGQQRRARHRHTDGKYDENRESASATHRTNCEPKYKRCQTTARCRTEKTPRACDIDVSMRIGSHPLVCALAWCVAVVSALPTAA